MLIEIMTIMDDPLKAYSLKTSGMCEAFLGMVVSSKEATAFHVNSIRTLMATLSRITILFHMSLAKQTRENKD